MVYQPLTEMLERRPFTLFRVQARKNTHAAEIQPLGAYYMTGEQHPPVRTVRSQPLPLLCFLTNNLKSTGNASIL
jgi:hypothetical protein